MYDQPMSMAGFSAANGSPSGALETGTAVLRLSGGLGGPHGVQYSDLTTALQTLDAADSVGRVVLEIDSPGGAVAGAHEAHLALAGMATPVTVRVLGYCTSAAYWVASAADRIEASPTAVLGQIGAQFATRKDDCDVIVTSTGDEAKNADPCEDADQYRAVLDEVASVFRADVARGRGVDVAKVLKDFGRGAILSARAALAAGMIDGLTEEDTMADKMPEAAAPDAPMDGAEEPSIEELKKKIAELEEALAEKDAASAEGEELEEDLPEDVAEASARFGGVVATVRALDAQVKGLLAAKAVAEKKAAVDALVMSGQIAPGFRATAEVLYDHSPDLFAGLKTQAPQVELARQSAPPTAEGASESVALDAKARAYMGAHAGVRYDQAITAVLKEG